MPRDILVSILSPVFLPVDWRKEEGKASRNSDCILHRQVWGGGGGEDSERVTCEVAPSDDEVHFLNMLKLSEGDVLSFVWVLEVRGQIFVQESLESLDEDLSISHVTIDEHFRDQLLLQLTSLLKESFREGPSNGSQDGFDLRPEHVFEDPALEPAGGVIHLFKYKLLHE